VNRLIAGLVAYVGLGILSWTTLSDRRIRLATLAILAMFAVKTWVHRKDFMHPGRVEASAGGSEAGDRSRNPEQSAAQSREL
jgi:hypothetical protein